MANSKGKSTNSNKTSTRTNTKSRAEGTSKKKAETTSKKKAEPVEEEEVSYVSEIVIWVIGAVMLIIELGNFGLCGAVSYVSKFFFGLFGIVEYVLPVAIMFAAFFLHINEYKRRAVNKVIFGSFVLLCIGMFGQLMQGIEQYDFKELFADGFEYQRGGGIVCGSLVYLLQAAVGRIGTYIIIVVAVIICVVLFAEVSVIDLVQGAFSTISDVHRDGREYGDEEEEDMEQRPAHRKRGTARYEEIVREDYPEDRDPVFADRKKPSVLESISVLPADTDQGILPAKEADPLPLNEEVHEITMTYDLNLPGEHMEPATDHIEEGTKTPARRRRKAVKKSVVPEVLPEPEQTVQPKTQTVSQPEISQPESSANAKADALAMENKTAATVENMSAKEVGSSDHTYQFPPLELLKKGKMQAAEKEDLIRQNAVKLQEVLKSFGVNVTMTNYSCGPSVTRYEMVPEQGVKVSKITGLADDIMMNLAAQSIRIEAPIPGKSAVGIEIPNAKRSGVGFRELIDTEKFIKHPSKIAFAVGKDIEGNVVVEDIAKMPHLLIAGATGSGKSVCTNTLIMSILYKARPDEVKLILIDPKQVELKVYNGIPHLLTPVVTDPKKAAGALNWAVAEMTKRYQMFSECNVRNIQGYNEKVREVQESGKIEEEKLEKMPQIVIIVDELADLMMVAKAEVEEAIVRLAQLARAAGIHLVIATQRPSVDVVTGLIKANVPSRIALSVSSGVDSRTIIDSVGAEKLLGNGDMLFYPTMYPKPLRVQGAYISDDEVINVVEYLKAQNGETTYSEEVTTQITSSSSSATAIGGGSAENERDEYFVQAGKFIIDKNKASIGMLQRMFKIGFNRAARIMDQLFEAGVVGPEEGTKPRQVLMSEEQFEEYVDEYF